MQNPSDDFTQDPMATILVEMPRELWKAIAQASYDAYRNPIHEIVYRLEQSFDGSIPRSDSGLQCSRAS